MYRYFYVWATVNNVRNTTTAGRIKPQKRWVIGYRLDFTARCVPTPDKSRH